MKALVTGGGGFLGRYITEQLATRGDQVRIFCRGDYPELREQGIEIHRGDLRDPDAVTAACADCDVVFHTAALPGIWGPWSLYYETNTRGAENVIEACRRQAVSRLVYTSSPSVVFGTAEHINADESLPYPQKYACHYPHTKALAERAVLAANGCDGLATCALRPHLLWGPRDNHLVPRLIERARSGQLRRVGDGENLVSVCYVENAAHAHLIAADALRVDSPVAGEAYFINEPLPVNLWRWIDQILELAGLPPVEKSISYASANAIGHLLEWGYRLTARRQEPMMTRFLAEQLSHSHYFKIDKARRDFGYEPLVSFDEGMRRLQHAISGEPAEAAVI